MIVDSHCHASSRWYEPFETLLFNMDRCGVDAAVLVQLLGAYDDADMIAACDAHPDRFAFVSAIDPDDSDPVAALRRASDAGAAGVRMRPGDRAAGDDPLAVWREAERLGLVVSSVSPVAGFLDGGLCDVAEACPSLAIVLEHLGGLARPDVGDRASARAGVLALAALPNLMLKVPGLGQLAPRRRRLDEGEIPLELEGIDELLGAVVDAFGAERLMWGSDFPPVASREGYAHALAWPRELLAARRGVDCDAILGETAARAFSLPRRRATPARR